MSVQALCQEAFQDLGVGDLPAEWVNGVWNSNFCDSSSLPEEAEGTVLNTEKWSAALSSCRQWLTRDIQEDDEAGFDGGFWSTILEVNVSHKSLMALTYCLMERCKQTAVARLCATYAAQLYMVLLQMPGSGAFKIFHPMLFQKALDVFYMWPERESVEEHRGKKKAKDPPASQKATSTRGSRKVKRGKRKRPNAEVDDGDEGVGGVPEVERMGGEGEEEEEGEDDSMSSLVSEVQLSEEENTEIKDSIRQLSLYLYQFLSSYSLRDHEASRYQVTQVLVRLTRTELVAGSGALITGSSIRPDCPLCLRAWSCLDLLFKPLHGGVERTATEVFQQLLPSLLLLTSSGSVCTASSLPAFLTTICQHTLTFVCHVFVQQGEAVVGPLKTLFQHLCTKVPDKAEYRGKLASVACRILTLFPDQRYSQLLDWLYKFSRNTKVAYRMFALDVVVELLSIPVREPSTQGKLLSIPVREPSTQGKLLSIPVREPSTQVLPVEDEGRLTSKFLVKMILSRCSDKAPSVRSKALMCLASATSCSLSGVVEATKWCIHSYTSADPLAGESASDRLIVSMLKRRAVDDKVGVRKAAIQALESVIRLDMDKIDNEDVQAIHERCLDPALSVRKQALASLTALMVDCPDLEFMQRLWLDGVLPSVMDRETGGQEKCMSLLERIVLCSIATKRRSTEFGNSVWKLLSIIAEEENLELRRYLRKALEYWSKEGKLTSAFIEAICSEVNDPEHGKAAWILLSEISQYISSIPNKFILSAWKQSSADILSTPDNDSPFLQVLTVVGNAAHSLGKVAIGDIKEKIERLLLTVRMSPAVIAAAINTLLQMCTLLKPQQYQVVVDGWCEPLLKMCDDYLSSVVLCTSDGDSQESVLDEKEVIRHLFILGEVAQLSPNNLSQHTCLMVQSLLVSNSDEPSSFRGGPLLPVMKKITLTSVLRAHVYITLGKLCLQNEELTKKCVAQMSKELETSDCPAVKNNVIVVLCDLAVRYSARIDPYIPVISSCMKDPSLMVRKQSLTLLTHLLQEDFVKWKGSLFFRFISTLLDDHLKKFAEFCLGHLLFTRHPTMFYQHFVECVFHFNNYEKHRVYNRFRQTEREKTLFCLKGGKCAAKRMEIYAFLLNHMTDEQRFQLTAKLCQEVIGGILDRAITMEGDDSMWLVKDTLAILACKEIKLSSMRKNLVKELADDGDMVGAAVASAQTKIISQMVKRNVIENIVPTVVSAKHLFEKDHSPLLKDLLTYLKELLNDYKNEVDDVLGADPQLAEELAFDLKRFEEEQRRATIQVPIPKTPLAQLASPLLTPGALSSPVDQAAGLEHAPVTPLRLRHTSRKDIPLSPLAVAATNRARRPPPAPPRAPCTPPPATVRNPAISRVVGRTLGISPLVAIAQTARAHLPSRTNQEARLPPPPTTTWVQVNLDPLTTPIAPRTLARAINADYGPHIITPVRILSDESNSPHLMKTPQLNLQKMPVSTGEPNSAGHRLPPRPPRDAPGDETILPCGRVASTPDGLAEMISFNASTMVPPSPIPSNASVQSYMDARRTAKPKYGISKRMCPASADIMMLSPDVEPRRLDKWKVK